MINYNEYEKVVQTAKELSMRKNRNYGDSGLVKFGVNGIVCRMGDKQDRLKNLTWDNQKDLNNESVEDTLIDIINYSIYCILLLKNKLIEENRDTKSKDIIHIDIRSVKKLKSKNGAQISPKQ